MTLPLTGVVKVTSAGNQVFDIHIFRSSGTGTALGVGNATVSYFPFGGTGGNSL